MAMMADRMAIMLVTLKNRHGDDWEPWFGEAIWEEQDGLGHTIRGWKEYKTALDIVRLWVKRLDKRENDDLGRSGSPDRPGEGAGRLAGTDVGT